MKKWISLFLALSLASLLGACGTSPGASSERQDAASNAGKASGETYTIKLAHVEPEERSTHVCAVKFKEYLERETGGKIKVELYPNAVLGGDVQITEAVSMGTVQMGFPATAVMSMYDDSWGVLAMPFLFDSAESCFAALDGDLGKTLGKTLEPQGIRCLGFSYNGPRSMTNSVRPINTPEDLKGLKVRVMEDPAYIDLFNTLGANATPMGFNELFTGLQQKTVDAQENPPSLIYTSKFQEVQKYLSMTEHVHDPLVVIINNDFYQSLPQEYQQLVEEASREFLMKEQIALELSETQKYVDLLAQDGMEVNDVSPENKEKFKEALKPMYEKYEAQLGKELFELARKYNQ